MRSSRFGPSKRAVFVALGLLVITAPAAATRLAGGEVPAFLLAWEGDSATEYVSAVVVVRADGTGRRKLAHAAWAAWAPDGSRIVFSGYREDSGSYDLFVRGLDGTSSTRLTRTPGDESSATWSPDGRLLAFTGGSKDAREVRVVARDGTGARTISLGALLGWSPDGSRLAAVRGRDLLITPLDGSASVSVATLGEGAQGRESEWPVWSPDGARFAYIRDFDLWVVPATGGDPRALTSTKDDMEQEISWSPDSSTIAYVRRPSNPNFLPTLWVADSALGTTRRLGDVGAVEPVWTPDGRTIVFVRGGKDNCNYKGGCDLEGYSVQEGSEPDNGIYAIRADGTGQRRLTRGYDIDPSVSPSGSHVAFWRAEDGGYADDLRIVGLSGGCTRSVARTPTDTSTPTEQSFSWNPKTPPLRRFRCVDLTLDVLRSDVSELGKPFTITYDIGNTGDRSATNVWLTVGFPGVFRPHPSARCKIAKRDTRWATVTCRLGKIRPGRRVRLEVDGVVAPRRPWDARQESTTIEEYVSAGAWGGDDSYGLNNSAGVRLVISRCTHAGTLQGDRLTGTVGSDYICGRLGNDRLRGLAGDDVLDGGGGSDRIDAGPGRDIVRARGGNDTVLAADGERDIVACGSGEDRVVVDQHDRVDTSCESVQHRR